jgi:hypothetical protein
LESQVDRNKLQNWLGLNSDLTDRLKRDGFGITAHDEPLRGDAGAPPSRLEGAEEALRGAGRHANDRPNAAPGAGRSTDS